MDSSDESCEMYVYPLDTKEPFGKAYLTHPIINKIIYNSKFLLEFIKNDSIDELLLLYTPLFKKINTIIPFLLAIIDKDVYELRKLLFSEYTTNSNCSSYNFHIIRY